MDQQVTQLKLSYKKQQLATIAMSCLWGATNVGCDYEICKYDSSLPGKLPLIRSLHMSCCFTKINSQKINTAIPKLVTILISFVLSLKCIAYSDYFIRTCKMVMDRPTTSVKNGMLAML